MTLERDDLRRELDAAKRDLEKTKRENDNLNNTCQQNKAMQDALTNELNDLRYQVDRLTKMNDEKFLELDRLRTQHQDLTLENACVKESLSCREKELLDLKRQLCEASCKVDDLSEHLEIAEREIECLKADNLEHETAHQRERLVLESDLRASED